MNPNTDDTDDLDPDDEALLDGFDIDPGLVEAFKVDDGGVGAGAVDLFEQEKPTDKPRFYCTGADRKDVDGKKLCSHKAHYAWTPPCPACGRWYDCKRIKSGGGESRHELTLGAMTKVKPMEHHPTGIPELDKVFGGGLVYGKVILFAGTRGTGKSRLLLQLASAFARPDRRVFFSSGEDDRNSVIQFAQTLELPPSDDIIIHGDVQGLVVDTLIDRMRHRKIKLWIIDSAQTVAHSSSEADYRTQEQLGKVCAFLSSFARQANVAVILIGQITEAGEMAGGSALKHGVDALVRFDQHPLALEDGTPVPGGENVRLLWVDGKSRIGSSNATAYMEMSDDNGSLQPLSKRLQRYLSKIELG